MQSTNSSGKIMLTLAIKQQLLSGFKRSVINGSFFPVVIRSSQFTNHARCGLMIQMETIFRHARPAHWSKLKLPLTLLKHCVWAWKVWDCNWKAPHLHGWSIPSSIKPLQRWPRKRLPMPFIGTPASQPLFNQRPTLATDGYGCTHTLCSTSWSWID